MSAFIEQGQDGKFYIEERVRTEYYETKRLYDYDYRRLLEQERWELYSAICYLTGFDYFDDRYSFIAEMGEMERAFEKINVVYPIFIKLIEEKNKESISNYPKVSPSLVDGIKSSEANQALDNDFSTKAASDQIIHSHSYFNKLLFVPNNDYQPNFRITLVEKDSKRIKEVEVVPSC